MMNSKMHWAVLALALALGSAQAQNSATNDVMNNSFENDEERVSSSQSPTMSFVGDRHRIGVGIDTEFDIFGEFLLTLTENARSAWLAEGWLGTEGAGGVKLNYHWIFGGETADGMGGEVYTDGRVAKLFLAADENQLDDRKLTFGGGYEYRDWFFSAYGMTALSDERQVNQVIDLEDILVQGTIDGRGFTRIDTLQRITDIFEAPYDWGAGLRVGRYFDNQLLRLRGGIDYEDGDFGASQMTASVNLDKFFADSPHAVSLRAGYARKRGAFEDDRNDLRASLVYSYSFGQRYRPTTEFRQQEFQVQPEPRFEQRAVASEVTLSDRATFDLDSAELRSSAENTLDEILGAILDGRLVGSIQVGGHTCNLGTERYNQGLSERRAQSVVDYLVSRGVERDRIVATGYGELQPRFSNDTEQSRSRNRRVEISFVTEQSRTERIQVGPDGPVTELRQVEVPVEAAWIRRALRNPVQHKRIVDYYRYQEVSETVLAGDVVFDNTAPEAVDDQFALDLDSVDNTLDVLANDSDADGDALTLASVGSPDNGQVVISGDLLLYTPAAGFVGSDSFSYTVQDGFGGQAQANVSVFISDPNQAPAAADDAATTEADQPVSIAVLANDSDPDGDTLTIATFTQPMNGSVQQEGDRLVYTPAAGFSGMDSFSYTATDGRGGEAQASVSVTVNDPNQPPSLTDDTAVTEVEQPVSIAVLANDSDPDGDILSIATFSQPMNGSVQQEGDSLVYTPAVGFSGMDSFSYTATDGRGGEAQASVSVTVNDPNQGPTAADDAATTEIEQPVSIAVLANDSDPDGDTLSIALFSQPMNGSVQQNGDSLVYTPAMGFTGTDSFSYTATDGRGGEAQASVSITVNDPNQAPTAADDAATTQIDQPVSIAVLANDNDPDGDTLTIATFTQPMNGSVQQDGDSLTYTPAMGFSGTDSFSYTATDGRGGEAVAQVNVNVNSAALNRPPVANPDAASGPPEVPIMVEVLANDFDPDGDPLTVISVVQIMGAASETIINADGSISFVISANCNGRNLYRYTISDPFGATSSALINVDRENESKNGAGATANSELNCGQ